MQAEIAKDQRVRDQAWLARKAADPTARRCYGPITGNRVPPEWIAEQGGAWRRCAEFLEFPKGPGKYTPKRLTAQTQPGWPEVPLQATLDARVRDAVEEGLPAWYGLVARWPPPDGALMMEDMVPSGDLPASFEPAWGKR